MYIPFPQFTFLFSYVILIKLDVGNCRQKDLEMEYIYDKRIDNALASHIQHSV
jgi:hypothetical protein